MPEIEWEWFTDTQYEYSENLYEKYGNTIFNIEFKIIGKYCTLGDYRTVDPQHPRCYYCGHYIKKGDWWVGEYTNPCMNCNESYMSYW